MATTPNRSWPTPDDNDLVRDGAAAIRALGDAIDGTVGQGFVYAGTRYYESSGHFEKADPLGQGDIGLRAIRVTVVGGGGGGGEVANRGNAGGGGGGGAQSFITDISGLDSSVTVERGAGGGSSLAGGQSSFGSLVVATGGGRGDSSQGGKGGSGTAGDLQLTGSGGGFGSREATVDRVLNGHGGDAAFGLGGGARGQNIPGPLPGEPGGLYGGGGSGAIAPSSTGNGGPGANGIVIVDCFV